MVFFVQKNFNDVNVINLANDNIIDLDFGDNRANLINSRIRKEVINGVLPDTIDLILANAVSKNILIELNEKNIRTLYSNTDLFSSMLRKDIKKLAFWLNEYLDIDDVYHFTNLIINFLLSRLIYNLDNRSLIEEHKDLRDYFLRTLN